MRALTERPACFEIVPRRRAVKRAYKDMGVGHSSSLRTTAERSPLHDVRQQAALDQGSRAASSDFMDDAFEIARRPPAHRSTVTPRKGLVEPDGIEPTTSCLQSRRSPN